LKGSERLISAKFDIELLFFFFFFFFCYGQPRLGLEQWAPHHQSRVAFQAVTVWPCSFPDLEGKIDSLSSMTRTLAWADDLKSGNGSGANPTI
jgi:hypothetical protein